MIEDLKGGPVGPGLGVVRGVDEAGDPGVEDGPSAHGAGLEGTDQGATGEAVVAEGETGGAEGDDLGVGGGVGGAKNLVVAGAENGGAVRGEHEGAYGDFASAFGEVRLLQGKEHESFVVEGHEVSLSRLAAPVCACQARAMSKHIETSVRRRPGLA